MQRQKYPEYSEVLQYEPLYLISWMERTFLEPIPSKIETMEDMAMAGQFMLRNTEGFTYIKELLSVAKIQTRQAKRLLDTDKKNAAYKEDYEDMVNRRDAIETIADVLKQQYTAVSRGVTIHTENNRELQMTGGVIC